MREIQLDLAVFLYLGLIKFFLKKSPPSFVKFWTNNSLYSKKVQEESAPPNKIK